MTQVEHELQTRLEESDITLFDDVVASLRFEDRRSLIALHLACRETYGLFDYLEIGSHLGGSLQALVRDPACRSIVSIDRRILEAPDERRVSTRYSGNTTANMLAGLARIPGADIGKIRTFDASVEELDAVDIRAGSSPVFCFVDGEHTDAAVVRDAEFCVAAMDGRGCIAFHDAEVVYRGIRRFVDRLEGQAQQFVAYLLPNSVFVVEVGEPRLRTTKPVQARLVESWRGYLYGLLDNDRYRLVLDSRVVRLLQRFGRLKI
jgi:hypothetical protein